MKNETSDVSLKYYVYILLSLRDEGFYIGFTSNLKKRLSLHANGEVASTKFRRPLRLVYFEYFINREDALAREEFLKSGFGRKNMKEMLKRTLLTFQTKN